MNFDFSDEQKMLRDLRWNIKGIDADKMLRDAQDLADDSQLDESISELGRLLIG